MAEDFLFASDYDGSYPLCKEEVDRPYLSLGIFEQQRNEQNRKKAELKRDGNESDSIAKKIKEAEETRKEISNLQQRCIETHDHKYDHGKREVLEMDKSKVELTKVQQEKSNEHEVGCDMVPPPQKKSMLQLDSSSPLNLMMMCEESVERSLSEELMLQAAVTMTVPAAPNLGNRSFSSSPFAEPKTFVPPGQLEVTLKHVCTTRRYTRFTSRPTPLLPLPSVHPETSLQPLPSVSNTSILPPGPKKKTRTSYSTDQLEELERVFQDDHYPDADKRKEIAISVGVTPQRVMVWFQNRRAKWRKTSKAAAKKVSVSRVQAPAPARVQVPVNRPALFKGPVIAPLPPQTGNKLPPHSTLLTSCTSPPGCVDVATTCVSQAGLGDFMPPIMQSPPPLRRASLPFFAAYNPPNYALSVLLDTPEHSEPQPFSMHTDTGFNYDLMGPSSKYEAGNGTQPYFLTTYPQQSSLLPQQSNALLSSQSNNVLSQQPNALLPQYSRMSYLTPSPYLTPNPSEGTTSSGLPLNPSTNSSLLACSNGGHSYFHSQNGSQILLQHGVQAMQAYSWAGDIYSHSTQVPHSLLKPQFTSERESHYPPLVPSQPYITPQRATSLTKSATPDPMLPSVKTELEETGHSQPARVSEPETIFHCDFSPIHF
ncbi:homeobox protein NOBOX-like [Trichomycterus rosablanca]|uniref:homeobox protein NOBOX-like n=1 Tax=Trichomycterus rosablanca TaxID=2290929 RepID=UPI002F35A1AE